MSWKTISTDDYNLPMTEEEYNKLSPQKKFELWLLWKKGEIDTTDSK